MRNIKDSKIESSAFIILATLTILALSQGAAICSDYDFSLTLVGQSASKVTPGELGDFYVDFKNEGTQNDSFMFYCEIVGSHKGWMASGCFEDVCWGPKTYQPEPFAAGESEHCHIQVITPSGTFGTVDASLKVVSEATGQTKTVYLTTSNEESPLPHVMIYTNQDNYKVGDDLIISLRTVNLGASKNADTYAAIVSGANAFFFKLRGNLELSTEVAPYTGNISYDTGYEKDEIILSFPLETYIGVNQLFLGAVLAEVGTANLIGDVSVAAISFE